MLEDYYKIQPEVKKEIQTYVDKVLGDLQREQQYEWSQIQAHAHTGTDSLPVVFNNINDKILTVWWTVPGTSAATATNYGVFFIAPFECTVISFYEVHQTAGTNGGTVTLQLERLQGTEAPDAGDALLTTALSLKATANTVQTGTITPTRVNGVGLATLSTGNRLCLKDAGTLTDVANVTVTLQLKY